MVGVMVGEGVEAIWRWGGEGGGALKDGRLVLGSAHCQFHSGVYFVQLRTGWGREGERRRERGEQEGEIWGVGKVGS